MAHVSFDDINNAVDDGEIKVCKSSVAEIQNLEDAKAISVFSNGDVHEIAADTSVSEVLEKYFGKYYSVPVVDEKGACLGLCGLRDVLKHVAEVVRAETGLESAEQIRHVPNERLEECLSSESGKLANSLKAPIRSIVNASGDYGYIPQNADLTLRKTMQNLSQSSCRRVIVTNNGKIAQIISPMSILRLFAKQPSYLVSFSDLKIEDSGLVSTPLFSVESSDRVLDAFLYMWENKVSAVAVKDEADMIYSVITLKDLRLALVKQGGLLGTVEQLIISTHEHDKLARFPVVSITQSDTLKHAIERMSATSLHRLIVKDNEGNFVGALALRDVVRALATKLFKD